jgi:hypothetical protein
MSDPLSILARSRALWNMSRLDLDNDEALAQILDRGSLEDWQALYALLARADAQALALRRRVRELLFRVPTGHPYFWLAALASLGERFEAGREPRLDDGSAGV